ncbi:hypothetical protein [Kineococcus esterisolvens]|uniref:hypothetical protein n=1 Tax=Kineococcus sp. SYSU DK030 TaxID=3383151 RepID=UPI003D7DB0A0
MGAGTATLEGRVLLDLSDTEASAVFELLHRVQGSAGGPRGALDRVRRSLAGAGIARPPVVTVGSVTMHPVEV